MACNKVETPSNNNTLSAVATIDTQTKTVYTDNGIGAGLKVDWADEDSFKAYYSGSSEPVIFSKTEAGTSFKAESVPDGVTSATAFTGLYGSNATYNGSINIDFSKQNGELDNIKDFDVMLASSELTDGVLSFAFKHKCAIIRLTVTNNSSDYDIQKVNITARDASIDTDFGTTGITQNSYCSLTFTLANSIQYNETKTVYCVVPAMSYKAGVVGTGVTTPHVVSISFNVPSTGIEAGKVYDRQMIYNGTYPPQIIK